VLVIGPGIGGEIDALVKGGNAISVYDVPGALLDFVRDYYGDKVRVITGLSVNDLNFYDMVVAIDVIEHIHPSSFKQFLKVIRLSLDPGGVLYCHNNFAQQDIYPMHYAENEQPFREWLSNNFQQTGDLTYQKLPVKVAA
jgi:cyclopropane fatty-acyl-phospholipid synthase-like methyltransferase